MNENERAAKALADRIECAIHNMIVHRSLVHLEPEDMRLCVTALRRNAPPDSGAGKSALYDRCPTCNLGWQLFPPTKIDNVDAVQCVECKAVYPSVTTDHGGADVGVGNTLLVWDEEVAAQAIYEHWANYPACSNSEPWSEICEKRPAQADDFRRKARAVKAALSKPAPVAANASAEQWATELPDGSVSFDAYAGWSRDQLKNRCLELVGRIEQLECTANASAEARLREALKEARLYVWLDSNVPKSKQTMLSFIDAALAAHPHASDCDKQGADHIMHNFSDAGGNTCKYCGNVKDSPNHKSRLTNAN